VSDAPPYVVQIERTVAATAGEVFDAWTSPEVMRRWLHVGPDWETPVANVDLRVGGEVRIVMRKPDGSQAGARGRYTEIERPHRLVMTWTFDVAPENEQVLELTFSEAGDSTTVLLVNRGIATDSRRAGQDQGWRGCLTELDRLLSGVAAERRE
jgi:uncharacterized protein YndB with AHSA1/START domain